MNSAKKTIISIIGIYLLGLLLFPSWYETNGQYVKQLGLHFLFRRPDAVPVDCYFVGCVTAPASYFHVVLDRGPWLEAMINVVFVASVLLLLFRRRADGAHASVRNPRMRWAFSGLVALILPVPIPATPILLMGMYGVSAPIYLFSGEDNSLVMSVAFPIIFSVYAVLIYLLSTVAVRISTRLRQQRARFID